MYADRMRHMTLLAFVAMVYLLILPSAVAQQPSPIEQRLNDLEKRVSQLERQSPPIATTPAASIPAKRENPFSEEERRDRYELLKTERRLQENLPEVASYFKNKQDPGQSSIEAKTHQAIAKLCEELSRIVPQIIAANADNSVSNLIAQQRQIFKTIDGVIAEEESAEMKTRLTISERTAALIAIDLQYNKKVLGFLDQ